MSQLSSLGKHVSKRKPTSQDHLPSSFSNSTSVEPKDVSISSRKLNAEIPIHTEEKIIETPVNKDSTRAALGTAILLSPSGMGGCSTSSGVSDIHDLVMNSMN